MNSSRICYVRRVRLDSVCRFFLVSNLSRHVTSSCCLATWGVYSPSIWNLNQVPLKILWHIAAAPQSSSFQRMDNDPQLPRKISARGRDSRCNYPQRRRDVACRGHLVNAVWAFYFVLLGGSGLWHAIGDHMVDSHLFLGNSSKTFLIVFCLANVCPSHGQGKAQ